MCTAISDKGVCHLFGRTLDLERSYGEMTVITPRAFPFNFIHEWGSVYHLAIIGTAHIRDGVPLYYDAVNERGLAMAALNFPDIAVYGNARSGAHNVASFELIPWILGRCDSVRDAVKLLRETNIVSDSFRPDLPTTPLHWMIADRHESVTVEPLNGGIEITENPVGVLTNAPKFSYHMTNLANHMRLSPESPENKICPAAELPRYSRGMGAIGLPGDYSSASRFVRAVFAKTHTARGDSDEEQIGRFFHIMDTVSQPLGTAVTDDGKPIGTVYTSCMDTASGTYYYTTYECRRIQSVCLFDHSLGNSHLVAFPREKSEDIRIVCKKM